MFGASDSSRRNSIERAATRILVLLAAWQCPLLARGQQSAAAPSGQTTTPSAAASPAIIKVIVLSNQPTNPYSAYSVTPSNVTIWYQTYFNPSTQRIQIVPPCTPGPCPPAGVPGAGGTKASGGATGTITGVKFDITDGTPTIAEGAARITGGTVTIPIKSVEISGGKPTIENGIPATTGCTVTVTGAVAAPEAATATGGTLTITGGTLEIKVVKEVKLTDGLLNTAGASPSITGGTKTIYGTAEITDFTATITSSAASANGVATSIKGVTAEITDSATTITGGSMFISGAAVAVKDRTTSIDGGTVTIIGGAAKTGGSKAVFTNATVTTTSARASTTSGSQPRSSAAESGTPKPGGFSLPLQPLVAGGGDPNSFDTMSPQVSETAALVFPAPAAGTNATSGQIQGPPQDLTQDPNSPMATAAPDALTIQFNPLWGQPPDSIDVEIHVGYRGRPGVYRASSIKNVDNSFKVPLPKFADGVMKQILLTGCYDLCGTIYLDVPAEVMVTPHYSKGSNDENNPPQPPEQAAPLRAKVPCMNPLTIMLQAKPFSGPL